MKAILEFNLPEDQEQFDEAINGVKWQFIVGRLDKYLRNQTKHAPDTMSDDTLNAYEKTRETLHEFINDEGLML